MRGRGRAGISERSEEKKRDEKYHSNKIFYVLAHKSTVCIHIYEAS